MADVVPLEYNNRILIRAGLQRIRAEKARPGIKALLQVCRIPEAQATEKDLSFSVAPRINAAGRLEDMTIGVKLLTTEDPAEAQALAERLHAINAERKEIEKTMVEDAAAQAERLIAQVGGEERRILCLVDPEGHEGVVGLVAGRLRERFNPCLYY